MSGTYPTSPGFTSVGFTSREYNLSSTSLSGRVQVRSLGSQRFEFTASYPPMERSTFLPVQAFIASQRGMSETFTIVLPDISENSGTASGAILTSAAGAIGDTSIAIDGITGILKAGSVFKFTGHSKVYMVTADRDGTGTLSFMPALTSAVSDNEALVYDNVPFTVRLANDVQEFAVNTNLHYSYEVDFIEAI